MTAEEPAQFEKRYTTTVADLVPHDQELIYAYMSDSVTKVLKLLTLHKILSLPVYSVEMKQWVAFVDMVDILCACCFYIFRK